MWIESLKWSLDTATKGFEISSHRHPHLIFCFGVVDAFDSRSVEMRAIQDLKRRYPEAYVVGCSTGSHFEGLDLHETGLSAIMVGFDATRLRVASERLADHKDSQALGRALGAKLAGTDLAAVYLLSDGLNVQGSELLRGLNKAVGGKVIISGGMAGDGSAFARTYVLSETTVEDRMVTAIGFYGEKLRVATGSAGGWVAFGPNRIITDSRGNVLQRLDGVPALEIYERYLGEEAKNLPASGLLYPLSIWDPQHPGHEVTRTLLAVDREAGTMTFAGDMPTGWRARLMQGRIEKLIDGAAEAANVALQDLRKKEAHPDAILCLAVSCIGRTLVLGQRTAEEIAAVVDVLGERAVVAGFYSNGEFSPQLNGTGGDLHNQTMTLTLLAEGA